MKILFSIIAATFIAMALGGLFYGLIFAGFYASEMANVPAGVLRNPPNMWYITGANVMIAALIVWFFAKTNIRTFMGGLKNGLLIGLLIGIYFDLMLFASLQFGTVQMILLDIVCSVVILGAMGGVSALILGTGKKD